MHNERQPQKPQTTAPAKKKKVTRLHYWPTRHWHLKTTTRGPPYLSTPLSTATCSHVTHSRARRADHARFGGRRASPLPPPSTHPIKNKQNNNTKKNTCVCRRHAGLVTRAQAGGELFLAQGAHKHVAVGRRRITWRRPCWVTFARNVRNAVPRNEPTRRLKGRPAYHPVATPPRMPCANASL